MWSTLALFVLLVPAPAQTVANSFEELRQVLKKGQTVVVTDAGGQQTKGKVADSLTNGALIGAAVGTGLAMWDYLIDPSEPGNAVVFTVAIGLGAAVGAGIDALVNRGGKVLNGAPRRTRRLTISPVLGKDRQAALVSVRF